jgi:putative NADPH-quinone reductase
VRDNLPCAGVEELAGDVRPALAGEMPDVSAYSTIFLGCPIWWGSEPMVVRSFLDAVDLTGKTIVPFTTHGGSGLGSVPANLQSYIADASFLEGKAIAGTDVDAAHDEVVSWAKSLGV